MRSSGVVVFFALCCCLPAVAEPGGHAVSLQLWAGHLDFHEDIRFDGDLVLEIGAGYEFNEWLELSLAVSQMRMWDRKREEWGQSVGFSMHWNVWPVAFQRAGLGGVVGVSFMGLEESAESTSMAEGFDLGIVCRWGIGRDLDLRAQLVGRLQSFNVVAVDAQGMPVGTREETGYLWSQLVRLGVSYAF